MASHLSRITFTVITFLLLYGLYGGTSNKVWKTWRKLPSVFLYNLHLQSCISSFLCPWWNFVRSSPPSSAIAHSFQLSKIQEDTFRLTQAVLSFLIKNSSQHYWNILNVFCFKLLLTLSLEGEMHTMLFSFEQSDSKTFH